MIREAIEGLLARCEQGYRDAHTEVQRTYWGEGISRLSSLIDELNGEEFDKQLGLPAVRDADDWQDELDRVRAFTAKGPSDGK